MTNGSAKMSNHSNNYHHNYQRKFAPQLPLLLFLAVVVKGNKTLAPVSTTRHEELDIKSPTTHPELYK